MNKQNKEGLKDIFYDLGDDFNGDVQIFNDDNSHILIIIIIIGEKLKKLEPIFKEIRERINRFESVYNKDNEYKLDVQIHLQDIKNSPNE